MKAIITTIEEEFQKARRPGAKDIKPRRKRAQWHEDFKKEHSRYPNQFEVFMNKFSRRSTSGKNMERHAKNGGTKG